MRERRQIVCLYGGRRREICPVVLGFTSNAERSLVFQFGGESGGGLAAGGDWRCLTLARVTVLELREGPWIVGDRYRAAQTCIENVEYDVNQDSPYNPRLRL